jgi:hypothetical protein
MAIARNNKTGPRQPKREVLELLLCTYSLGLLDGVCGWSSSLLFYGFLIL